MKVQRCSIDTNVLTKFHEDLRINVLISALTRQMPPPPPGSHVFQGTETVFEIQPRYLNVISREVKRFYYSNIWKTALHLTAMVLSGLDLRPTMTNRALKCFCRKRKFEVPKGCLSPLRCKENGIF
ncbi:hypothetical protein DPMN_059969 [Dreissena polymorpha]|uniref:Uncharacterized protein n=1 Tax=Dreissena polymorpha TaxID=45954 RepID=A0A9D4C4V6_DREPO|nr:hypothetical protein DPMN_059969 [Dreissena polymorpha]